MGQPTNKSEHEIGTLLRELLFASVVSLPAYVVVGYLKSTYLFSSIGNDILQTFATIIVLILAFVLIRRKLSTQHRIFVVAFMVLLVFIGNFAIQWIAARQPSVYFVIDDSENMGTYVQRIVPYVRNSVRDYGDESYVGFAVFGRNAITPPIASDGCNSVSQWVELQPKGEISSNLDRELNALQNETGQGRGTLQNAVVYAIDRLVGRRVVANIVVITSRFDNRCGEFSRRAIDEHANELGVLYELTILTVGSVPDFDALMYARCADRYDHVGDDFDRIETIVRIFGNTRAFPYGRFYNLSSQPAQC